MKYMNFSLLCIAFMFGDILATQQLEHERRQAAAVGSVVLEVFGKALAPQVEKLANALGDSLVQALFGTDPHTSIMGRSVVVSSNGNTASIKDISTGITIVGYGNTPEEAMGDATNKLIVTLYQGGFISIHDLHLAPVITSTPFHVQMHSPQHIVNLQRDLDFVLNFTVHIVSLMNIVTRLARVAEKKYIKDDNTE